MINRVIKKVYVYKNKKKKRKLAVYIIEYIFKKKMGLVSATSP